MMLEVSVLGVVEVRRDGRIVPIPGGRTTELLVRLALEAGTAVRVDRLIEDLWGDEAVSTSRNTLQAKVARLRRALGEPGAVQAVDDGYRLVVGRGAVDALAVADASMSASSLLAAGDVGGAARVADEALARFRGDGPVVADGPWAEPHRAALGRVRRALLETSFDARLRAGASRELVVPLEAAVAEHAFDERLWALLATALYRSGRQADALGALRRAGAVLRDELGLEPGPALRELEQQILDHDPALGAAPSAPTATVPTGNLPALTGRLVGRQADVAAVVGLVGRHALVTVVGPGGVGKTALAVAAARALDAPGGVWLARLESSGARDVGDAVSAALGVVGDEGALRRRLAARPAVIVLDNCEHVLDAVADLARTLLDGAPGTRLLCTSQAPLGLDGEVLHDVAPLAPADAVELFADRSRAQRRGRAPDGDDTVVAELCRALDGLPLAIELAAARTRTLSVADIARRLDDRLALLVDPASRRPARQRALGAAIAWSYDLLFDDDRRGLWALATFPGGATLEATERVLQALGVPPEATLDVVDRLVTRSLVIVDDADPPRYRLLESVRSFALAALGDAGHDRTAFDARTAWYVDLAAVATGAARGHDQARHLAHVRAERANIDAVLAWCAVHDPDRGLAVAVGFGWAWIVLGDSRGARRVVDALEAAGDRADLRRRSDALLLASWLEASLDDLDTARGHLDAVDALADELDDDEVRARAGYHRAYVVSHEGAFGAALELTGRSRRVYETMDRPWDRAANALFALRAATSAADPERAAEAAVHAEDALAMVDDPWLHARHEAMRGELARLQHRFDDAVRHLTSAAAMSAARGYLQTEAYQVATLGRAQCQAGDDAAGAATLARAVDKAEAIGDLRMAALARVHLGRVRRALGDTAGARDALDAAAAWHAAVGGGEQALLGECLRAALDAADGVAGAAGRLEDVLDAARRVGTHPHVEVFALDALGRLASSADPRRAQARWREADERMSAAAHFVSERDRTDRYAAPTPDRP